MEILDCFCGVGAWAERNRILPHRPEEILALMDHVGIGKALIYHNAIKFSGLAQYCNRAVAELARTQPRFIPAFILELHPHRDPAGLEADLAAMQAAGAKALWLQLPFTHRRQAERIDHPWLIGDWLHACSEKRIPVFYHATDENAGIMHALCSEFPKLRLILTGIMYNGDPYLYPLLRRHRQLRVCLGHMYIPSGNPGRFLRYFPADRLLFGSGLPEFSPGGLLAHVQYADIPDADKALILGGNLRRLMEEVRL